MTWPLKAKTSTTTKTRPSMLVDSIVSHGARTIHSTSYPTPSFANANRVDPTRTVILRRDFERDAVQRFRDVANAAAERLLDQPLVVNAYEFTTTTAKIDDFMAWLRKLTDEKVLEVKYGTQARSGRDAWSNIYIKSAYQKGVARAAAQMRKGGVRVSDRWVNAAILRPIHADRVGLAYTRTFTTLRGITSAMDTKISQSLALGLAEGRAPKYIAKMIVSDVETIGINRARVLARTEVINAHATATLNSFEEANIQGVQVESEFATAQDNKVCPKCASLEGKIYTISEAQGVIPVHPNCRCAWLPVVSDDSSKELL